MNPNQNQNFLNSASNYWASKLKCIQKSSPKTDLPNTNSLSQYPASFPQRNVYQKTQITPGQINQMTPQSQMNYNYYIPSIPTNQNFQQLGNRFQNLANSGQMYNPPMKMTPNPIIENQNNYPAYYPYPNLNENVFGTVLNKANNFWHPNSNPQFSQRQQPYYYSPRFHSDPISREFSSSNKESEQFSLEISPFLKTHQEETPGKTSNFQQIHKTIKKKKSYKKKNKSESKNCNNQKKSNDSVAIAKKLLAIANNWQEVCKKIPSNLQNTFKEKMKRYLKKRILPDLLLKNKLQKFVQMKDSSLDTDPQALNENANEENQNNSNDIRKDSFDSDLKFDQIFGKDLEKLLFKNEGNSLLQKEAAELDWQNPSNQAYDQQFELESPTLSKILRPDALSFNFNIKEKDGFIDDYEQKSLFSENRLERNNNYGLNKKFDENNLFYEESIHKNGTELNLADFMVNEKKEEIFKFGE